MDTFWLVDSYLRVLINHAYAMHTLNGSPGKGISIQSRPKLFGNITELPYIIYRANW